MNSIACLRLSQNVGAFVQVASSSRETIILSRKYFFSFQLLNTLKIRPLPPGYSFIFKNFHSCLGDFDLVEIVQLSG